MVLIDREDVADADLVGEGVEREAIRHLTRLGCHEETASLLAEIVAEMAEAFDDEDWNRVSEADLRFQDCLVDACKSPRPSGMFSTLIVETRVCLRKLSHAYPAQNNPVEEHYEIQDLNAGDCDSAAALDRHFSEASDALRDEIDDRARFFHFVAKTEDGS